jgi:hypothetical protein
LCNEKCVPNRLVLPTIHHLQNTLQNLAYCFLKLVLQFTFQLRQLVVNSSTPKPLDFCVTDLYAVYPGFDYCSYGSSFSAFKCPIILGASVLVFTKFIFSHVYNIFILTSKQSCYFWDPIPTWRMVSSGLLRRVARPVSPINGIWSTIWETLLCISFSFGHVNISS